MPLQKRDTHMNWGKLQRSLWRKRLIGWLAEWTQSFRRLYTLIKGMLWSRRNISEILKLALLPVDNKPPPPQNEEQLLFDFGWQFCSKTKIWQNHFFQKSNFSRSNTEKIPVFWKIMGYLWENYEKSRKKAEKICILPKRVYINGTVSTISVTNCQWRDSSVGRAGDWKSPCPRFDPGSCHHFLP